MPQLSVVRNHIIAFIAALIVFCVSLLISAAQNSDYPPLTLSTPSTQPPIVNAYVLQDRMPLSVYRYTLARIDDYLLLNNAPASGLRIQGNITSLTSTYDFTIAILPSGQTLNLGVTVTNNAGYISTSVTVNNQLQAPYVPGSSTALGSTVTYSGFDALISKGLTAIQANELGRALNAFMPAATSITIDPNSVSAALPAADQNSVDATYTFSIKLDSKYYGAMLTAIGPYDSRLVLTDTQTHKTVYSSGVLDQGS